MMTGSEERQAELVEQGAGNAVADLKAGFGEAAAPQFPAAEVAANFQMAADAGAEPVVEQGDGWYWMEQARYWEERCLRAESVNPLGPSELEEERDFWMGRARKAETTLRQVSIWVGQMERALKGQVSDG